jgi:hypothetical protein
MVSGASGPRMRRAREPEACQIELVDKQIHHPDQMILIDPVLKTVRKQRHLIPVHPCNET